MNHTKQNETKTKYQKKRFVCGCHKYSHLMHNTSIIINPFLAILTLHLLCSNNDNLKKIKQ